MQQTSAVGIFTRRGGQLWCFGLWGGGLVSFLKVSSLSALPMARSRRLRGWGRNFPFRRTSLHSHPLLKVPCSAVETVHRILSASGLSSPNGYPLSADNPGQTSHVMLYKGTSSSTAGPSRFHARNKKEGGSARCSGFDFRGAAESSSASCYILELSCGLVGESFGRPLLTTHKQQKLAGVCRRVYSGTSDSLSFTMYPWIRSCSARSTAAAVLFSLRLFPSLSSLKVLKTCSTQWRLRARF